MTWSTGLESDLEAMAELGWGPDHFNRHASIGFEPGQFATFRALEPDVRNLVLRMLGSPTDADHDELAALSFGRELAAWLLTLPAYRDVPDDDPE